VAAGNEPVISSRTSYYPFTLATPETQCSAAGVQQLNTVAFTGTSTPTIEIISEGKPVAHVPGVELRALHDQRK
jgi:hypothetical protein